MSYIYEPEIEEEEGGYSIPKILVAILLLILIGAGVYIYIQQKRLTTSITYLLDSKKQVEQDLNQMIEKYNLAIDDNGSLESELKQERDQIIRYRDSIKGVKDKGSDDISTFKKEITRLKEKSAIDFGRKKEKESTPIIVSEEIDSINNTVESTEDLTTNEGLTTNEDLASNEEVSSSETESTTEEVKEKTITSTTFNRVEIPPIYPGCDSGSATEKKACFAKKVKKHLSRKFDASIIDNLNLSSGKKRIWAHFNIDEYGNITNVTAKGAHKYLEHEAIRVIKELPKMKAAKQNGNSVQISYSVPITIRVE